MPTSLLQRIVAPVATPEDAKATANALAAYIADSAATVVAVHVIEKGGGAPDKAPLTKREQYAGEVFDIFADSFGGREVSLETDLRYGPDVAASIIDAAHKNEASAIVFTPRGDSRWRKLLTGDVTHNLVQDSEIPILVLPRGERVVSETRQRS